jgi:DNA-directed RNA polymerase I subunit RPA43
MAPIAEDDYSLLHIERISQYVSLSPASLNDPLPALCASIFSPLLLSYFPPAKGIVLAYEDVDLSDKPPRTALATSKKSRSQREQPYDDEPHKESLLLRHIDEYTAPFLWATASFLIWRPRAHAHISGRITHQSHTHITLSHLNTFPVSITKDHFPSNWSWHSETTGKVKKGWDGRLSDEGGWWVDGEGEKVDGDLRVRIRDFDGRMEGKGKGKGFIRIEGSLLSQEEEKARSAQKGGKGKQRANGVLRTQQRQEETSGEAMEIE